jgi:osmotically-inducible protein OsmY
MMGCESMKKINKILTSIFLSSCAISAFPDVMSKPGASGGAPSASAVSTATPAETDNITSTIETSIETNHDVSDLNIDVTNKGGIIKLVGNTVSNKQAGILVEIAESATGVKDVDVSRLLTRNLQPVPAGVLISAKIKGTFIREKLFSEDLVGMPITVKTINGTVFLSGSVSSQALVDNAIKMAKTVSGVGTVKSELIVTEPLGRLSASPNPPNQ